MVTMFCGFLPPSGVGAIIGCYAFIVLGFAIMQAIPFVLYAGSQRNKSA